MTVLVQRMCNSRIDRNIVGGVRFESVRLTIHDSKIPPTNDDFTKYAEICTQLFPPTASETDILGEIIHAGIETMHMLAQMDKDHREDETDLQRKLRLMNENVHYGRVNE